MSLDINTLSWSELNHILLNTQDVDLLEKWLARTLQSKTLYRALRVHGRLNAVRREQEIAAIKKRCHDRLE